MFIYTEEEENEKKLDVEDVEKDSENVIIIVSVMLVLALNVVNVLLVAVAAEKKMTYPKLNIEKRKFVLFKKQQENMHGFVIYLLIKFYCILLLLCLYSNLLILDLNQIYLNI